ncbi:MAG: purine-cytosine permease family protein [Salinibacterium amurskyense]
MNTTTTDPTAFPENAAQITSALDVETRGIDLIPERERRGKSREQFYIWAAVNWAVTGFVMGAIIGSLGLSLSASISAMLVGQLAYVFVGIVAGAGARTGTATMVISRAAFGIRANKPLVALAWLSAVGWETVNVVVGVSALLTLFSVLGWGTGIIHTVGALIFVLGVVTVAAVWGHALIIALQRIMTWALAVGMVIAIYFGLPYVDWAYAGGELAADNPVSTWFLALGIAVAGGALSFVTIASDYSRYLPTQTSIRAISSWTTLGALFPSILTMSFGILVASTIDLSVDPVGAFEQILPSGYLVPFLLVVVLGLMTNNTVNLYSSGLALQTMGINVRRWTAVVLDSILVGVAATIALFAFDFVDFFVEFLSMLIVWTAPWCGIFVVDFAMRKWYYNNLDDLFAKHGGAFWYSNGINWRAVGAWVLGALAAFMTTNATLWVSPWSVNYLGGADIAWIAGVIVAGLAYFAFTKAWPTTAQKKEIV